jgi:hypothetical protein
MDYLGENDGENWMDGLEEEEPMEAGFCFASVLLPVLLR